MIGAALLLFLNLQRCQDRYESFFSCANLVNYNVSLEPRVRVNLLCRELTTTRYPETLPPNKKED